jgi:hypothetical protein
MYLTDGENDGVEGGDTYFPCLRSAAPGRAGAEPWPSCASLAADFGRGDFIVDGATTALGDAVRGCARGGGVRGVPKRGDALLFANAADAGARVPLPLMWHRGCAVTRGRKLLATKFKARRRTRDDRRAAHAAIWEAS